MTRRTEDSPLAQLCTAQEEVALLAYAMKQARHPNVEVLPSVTASRYIRYATLLHLDAACLIAQHLVETANAKHWWYWTARRNPAGIGVTGAWLPGPLTTAAGSAWTESAPTHPRGHGIVKGHTFPTYAAATLTHARMLAQYTVNPLGPGGLPTTATDRQLAAAAEGHLAINAPRSHRGIATTYAHLGSARNPTGKGWAVPGDTYGHKLATLANQMLGYN
jgi:hypothetical protein